MISREHLTALLMEKVVYFPIRRIWAFRCQIIRPNLDSVAALLKIKKGEQKPQLNNSYLFSFPNQHKSSNSENQKKIA